MIESTNTPAMQMKQPMALRPEMDSLKTIAEPTITTTLLAVLATEFVTAEVLVRVMVASSLYPSMEDEDD